MRRRCLYSLDSLGEVNLRTLLGLPCRPIDPTLGTCRCFGNSFLPPVKLFLLSLPLCTKSPPTFSFISSMSPSEAGEVARGEVAAE
jgi:hypothetical protein